MKIHIDGQGMDVTTALKDLTIKKMERTLAHFDSVNSVHVILKVDNGAEQSASVDVSVPGTTINAHAKSDDMYKAIDMMAHNLSTQLAKHKAKLKDHRD